jgi:HAD superfamily hydrolase (TIGR01490 family)
LSTAPQLVFFDLDGTITRGDTLVPYVLGVLWRRPWRLLRLAPVLLALVRFASKQIDHGGLKSSLIHCALGGLSRAQLEPWTRIFVLRVADRRTFGDALVAIEKHRNQNDRLILMSASVDLYVPELARELGFRETICSGVRWDGDRLHGALATANCRGDEKTRWVQVLKTQNPGMRTVAYANSASDFSHLLLVDEPWLVNGSKRTLEEARALVRRGPQWAAIRAVRWR